MEVPNVDFKDPPDYHLDNRADSKENHWGGGYGGPGGRRWQPGWGEGGSGEVEEKKKC